MEYTELFNNLREAERVRVSTNWLPLVDMFIAKDVEFGFSFNNLQTVCEGVFVNKSNF